MKQIILSFIFWLALLVTCNCQVILTGQTLDSVSKEPIPFAHIYIQNTHFGTVADEYGYFTLKLPAKVDAPIRFTSIGYKSLILKEIPEGGKIYFLSEPLILSPVNITASSEVAREIVRKAFKNIKKNYFREPIVMNTFYRHYCLDNDKYGRIIEAQVDIYKKNGYGRQEDYSNSKDQFRINELRRSLDQSRLNALMHQPMALDLALKSDIVALKQRTGDENKVVSAVIGLENFIDHRKKSPFNYILRGKVIFNEQEVYIIDFEYVGVENTNGIHDFEYSGQFKIDINDYAILEYETEITSLKSFVSQKASYRRFGDKYALFHSKSLITQRNNSGMEHVVKIELITENLRKEKNKDIQESEITRAYLASIDYDSVFWANYMIGRPPIPEKAVYDLASSDELHQQFISKNDYEKQFSKSILEGEERLDSLLLTTNEPVILYVWASWDRNSWIEYVRNRERIKSFLPDFEFILLSIDEDVNQWINVSQGLNIDEPQIRLGPNSRFLKRHRIKELPLILIYQNDSVIYKSFNDLASTIDYLKSADAEF